MKKTDISFIAALIEGEGCIHIQRMNTGKRAKRAGYQLTISMKNTALSLLKFCKERVGGKIKKRKPSKTGKYITHQWRIHGKGAYKVLNLIFPYLISKKKQANLGMKFQEEKNKTFSGSILTQKERNLRNRMYLRMRELKSEGRKLINKKM